MITAQGCDRGAIVADWFTPLSRAEIAARHGCSERNITRIWQVAKELGNLPAHNRSRDGRDEQIVADWFEPLTTAQVAEKHDCSTSTVERLWVQARADGTLPDTRRERPQDVSGDPLPPLDPANVDSESARDLFRQVLIQAASDAVGDDAVERTAARDWFLRADDDGHFELVCELAGYDAQTIRSRFATTIKEIDGAIL